MKKIITVRDRAIEAYGQPFFVRAIGEAIRSFVDETNRTESAIGAHPEDYELYEIGEFDEDTGTITPNKPRLIAKGKDVKHPIE